MSTYPYDPLFKATSNHSTLHLISPHPFITLHSSPSHQTHTNDHFPFPPYYSSSHFPHAPPRTAFAGGSLQGTVAAPPTKHRHCRHAHAAPPQRSRHHTRPYGLWIIQPNPPQRKMPPRPTWEGRQNRLHRTLHWIRRRKKHIPRPLRPNQPLVLLRFGFSRRSISPNRWLQWRRPCSQNHAPVPHMRMARSWIWTRSTKMVRDKSHLARWTTNNNWRNKTIQLRVLPQDTNHG